MEKCAAVNKVKWDFAFLTLLLFCQETIENVNKCKNFLSTLIKLASNGKQSTETAATVRGLVKDLLVREPYKQEANLIPPSDILFTRFTLAKDTPQIKNKHCIIYACNDHSHFPVSRAFVFSQEGKLETEEFTSRLYKELNSSPQPYLVPFLKVGNFFFDVIFHS